MAREKLLQDKCLTLLRGEGIYCLNLYGDGRSGKGKPDIIACIDGKFIAIELKVGNNDLRPDQLIHKRRIERSGGAHFTIRSVDELKTAIRSVRERKDKKNERKRC